MKHKVTKAIFPVAGQGTRCWPATKSIPKEIMTLVDRPLVQYAIDEAPELERTLRKKGKAELLSVLKSTNMESGAIAYIRQHQAMGLGHAVWCARRLIGDEPFAVLLPDDVISAQKPCLQQMVEAYEETGGSMVAAMRVSSKDASSYGMLDIEKEQGPLVSVRGMVEKPPLGHEPSNFAVIGRYILPPTIMRNLTKIKRGAWASQTQIIQGFCKFAPPHMIVRADSLEEDLKLLTQQVGLSWQNPPPASRPQSPALSEIYDTELEALAREAYAADYSNFGFKPLDF